MIHGVAEIRMSIQVKTLDHLVLTVRDIESTCRFYSMALGMEVRQFGDGRTALHFGQHKINLHLKGAELEPKAHRPGTGTADLCFLIEGSLAEMSRHLKDNGIPVEMGPLERTGAQGPILSVYIRDPDNNLLELAQPLY